MNHVMTVRQIMKLSAELERMRREEREADRTIYDAIRRGVKFTYEYER